jgi:hypothetical protein
MNEPIPGGLDSLNGMAAEADAAAHAAMNPDAAAQAAEAAANAPDYQRGASAMVDMVSAMLDGYAPGAGWNEPTRGRMAASLAPVFEKYGLDVETALPCELVAIMVCGPAVYQSARVVALKIQTDRLALQRAARGLDTPPSPAPQPAPAGEPVSDPNRNAATEAALGGAASGLPVFPPM